MQDRQWVDVEPMSVSDALRQFSDLLRVSLRCQDDEGAASAGSGEGAVSEGAASAGQR